MHLVLLKVGIMEALLHNYFDNVIFLLLSRIGIQAQNSVCMTCLPLTRFRRLIPSSKARM